MTSKIVYKISSETFANLTGLLRISFLTSNNVPTIGFENVKQALRKY